MGIKIIKHGVANYQRLVKFKCKTCGCIWVADKDEDCETDWSIHSTPWTCPCPECHTVTREWWDSQGGGTITEEDY